MEPSTETRVHLEAMTAPSRSAWLDLYWLPLGADGSRVVRACGRAYEWLSARRSGRGRRALYHSALKVHMDGVTYVIEVAPVWSRSDPDRGVVAEGAVGTRLLGGTRWFRYEVRCWRNGVLPDEEQAVASPVRLSIDNARAAAVLDLVHRVPTLVWGRDELGTGEMWNSNSVIAWLLAATGDSAVEPPVGGRAPGWAAGLVVVDCSHVAKARTSHGTEARIGTNGTSGTGTRGPILRSPWKEGP